jgi:hypothetical protein
MTSLEANGAQSCRDGAMWRAVLGRENASFRCTFQLGHLMQHATATCNLQHDAKRNMQHALGPIGRVHAPRKSRHDVAICDAIHR